MRRRLWRPLLDDRALRGAAQAPDIRNCHPLAMEGILAWIMTDNPRGLLIGIPQLLVFIAAVVAVVLVIRSLRSIDRSLKALLARDAASVASEPAEGTAR